MLANGLNPIPPGKIAATVTFLDMEKRPTWLDEASVAPSLELVPKAKIPLSDYRRLFQEIGENWLWTSRLLMSDEELSKIIHGPSTKIYLIELDGEVAGLSELKQVNPTTVEIAFFGLRPEFTGRKIGRDVMTLTLRIAWKERTRTVCLQTCNFDHPAALGFYQKCGFQPVRFAIELMDDPRITGTLPKSAAPHIPLLNNDLTNPT
ncbi:MAG: GNAT family N-acetyltransferase [Hyphomicrobiales bacterium]